jgi:hypothetical protein
MQLFNLPFLLALLAYILVDNLFALVFKHMDYLDMVDELGVSKLYILTLVVVDNSVVEDILFVVVADIDYIDLNIEIEDIVIRKIVLVEFHMMVEIHKFVGVEIEVLQLLMELHKVDLHKDY